jgi:sulfur-oxidizing protein SoxY
MFKPRRKFIKKMLSIAGYGLALTSGLFYSSLTKAQWFNENYSPGKYDETLSRLFNGVKFIDTKKIKLGRLPRVAEDGRLVPIIVSTSLKNVEKITILVEKNPTPLSAEFYLSPAVEPRISARLKMAKTCDVIVIIEANGKYYRKSQNVTVIEGGCGG